MKTNGKRKFIVRNKAHHKFCFERPQYDAMHIEKALSAYVLYMCVCVFNEHCHLLSTVGSLWCSWCCAVEKSAILIPTIHYTFKIHRHFHTESIAHQVCTHHDVSLSLVLSVLFSYV